MPTQLTQTVSLLYQMQSADRDKLYEQLVQARKRAWTEALAQQVVKNGCKGIPIRYPHREDLKWVEDISATDADNITATWNSEVERKIESLYADNPRANRNTYFSQLEAWNTQRNTWKLPQIALMTEMTTFAYATRRFEDMNYEGGLKYIFDGPAPTCDRCINLFAAGIVDRAYAERHGTPIHNGCPHYWSVVSAPKLKCEDLWLG